MKKSIILLILILFFFRVNAETEFSPEFNVTVNVVGFPNFIILEPTSQIYFNETINLKILTNGDNSWYNIDNGINYSFNNFTNFYTVNGNHVLNVFSENIYGVSSKNVSFGVDTNLFRVKYEEYSGLYRGNSTDFNRYNYYDVQNLDNIILENTNFGKVSFYEKINLTDDYNFSDGLLDLDSNTEILQNHLNININYLGNFNKNSTIVFYNINLNNPRILLNDQECSLNICMLISYIGGKFMFNTTQLGNFIIDERPVINQGGGNNGGGGGGGGSGGGGGGVANNVIDKLSNKGNFIIDKDRIVIKLKQGEAKREKLILDNIGSDNIELNLENVELEKFLSYSGSKFTLKKGEKTTIIFDFFAKEDIKADVYTGKIILINGNVKKEIPVSIEVMERNPNLDVKLEIPNEYLKISKGGELKANLNIKNIEETGTIKVIINYIIKDSEDNIMYQESNDLSFESEVNIEKNFIIPKNAGVGEYVLYVNVNYNGKTANSSAFFSVTRYFYVIIIIVILSILLVFFIILKYKIYRDKKNDKKLVGIAEEGHI